MSKKETTKRYLLLTLGLFINAFGISFITKASLGTSPISSIPYVLSLRFEPTLGMFTFLFNMLLIVGQILLLRRRFQKIQLLQIPITILFSYFIDVTMELLSFMQPELYAAKLGFLLLGCAILAFGVFAEVTADVVMLAGEAFVKALADTIKKEFGIVKVCCDSTFMLCSLGLSLLFFQQLSGVREGTVICALIVGFIVRFYQRHLGLIKNAVLSPAQTAAAEPAAGVPAAVRSSAAESAAVSSAAGGSAAVSSAAVSSAAGGSKEEGHAGGYGNTVITISRQYGSGGRELGEKLAVRLGIRFYDKEIIGMAAEESGYSAEYIEKNEQAVRNPIIYELVASDCAYLPGESTPQETLFEVEARIIRRIAAQGPCVIVGRCADYILREREDCLNVYIHAPADSRVQRLMKTEELTERKAREEIVRADKERAGHYRRFTGRGWGDPRYYDLIIDSGVFGVDGAAAIVEQAVRNLEGEESWAM